MIGSAERFINRYKRDAAATMPTDQWDAWVDALPMDEFMAMLDIGRASGFHISGDIRQSLPPYNVWRLP